MSKPIDLKNYRLVTADEKKKYPKPECAVVTIVSDANRYHGTVESEAYPIANNSRWGTSEGRLYYVPIGFQFETGEKAPYTFKVGGKYNWKNQPERLVYLGYKVSGNGFWHQFALVGNISKVLCEVKEDSLQYFEESNEQSSEIDYKAAIERARQTIAKEIKQTCGDYKAGLGRALEIINEELEK